MNPFPPIANSRLEESLRFEALMVDLSAQFVSLPADEVDGQIEHAQCRICECLDLDSSLLWQFPNPSSEYMELTHLHRPLGGPPTPLRFEVKEAFPWACSQLGAGRMYVHASMDDLPPEAACDRSSFRRYGVKSNVGLPLSVGGGPLLGALTFNTMRAERTWPEPIVKRLQLVAQIFANALARKRANAQANLHLQKLAHLNRVAQTGELTTALAHELNQPLGAILRNAEAAEMLLQDDTPDLDELRAIVADIKRDDARAGGVIDRLRALLQQRALELLPVDLARLVDEVVFLMHSDPKSRRVRIETDIPADLSRVQCDRVHIQQVLLNLIMNGIDATGSALSGGPCIVCIGIRARTADDQRIEVSVSDTGSGISPEAMPRVFDPFFTTKADGIGVGLAISKTIIDAHAGRFWASNNAARGATFHFTLAALATGDSD